MELVKQPAIKGFAVTIEGDCNDGDWRTENWVFPEDRLDEIMKYAVIIEDYFSYNKNMHDAPYNTHDVRIDDDFPKLYLTQKYGFNIDSDKIEEISNEFYDLIISLCPSDNEGYYCHTVKKIVFRIDNEDYQISWKPEEVKGILAELLRLPVE